ncbi:hypothetical protein NPIL_158691 [Nephila pilipes]|uniref:Uncharacterized protein n=1 Tax=Nephila pilipes TaxID=299642 RepID=A0A8X6U2N4_NEPPI|nr:hypothetical protein NPIL_158691 [Nephila pilipes]
MYSPESVFHVSVDTRVDFSDQKFIFKRDTVSKQFLMGPLASISVTCFLLVVLLGVYVLVQYYEQLNILEMCLLTPSLEESDEHAGKDLPAGSCFYFLPQNKSFKEYNGRCLPIPFAISSIEWSRGRQHRSCLVFVLQHFSTRLSYFFCCGSGKLWTSFIPLSQDCPRPFLAEDEEKCNINTQ